MSLTVWAGLALLILANALYVAAEFGAVGVRRSRVRRLSEDGHWLARQLLPYIDHPAALDHYVGASQIGISASSLVLGAFGQATVTVALAPAIAAQLGFDDVTAWSAASVIVLIGLTSLQLVIGELVPKAIALQYPTQTALATVIPMRWSIRLFRPFLAVLNGTATLLLKAIGSEIKGHRHLHSPEEIDLLIAESRDGGLLEADEQQRLRKALRLGGRKARDLMVPVDTLTMIPVDAPWVEVERVVSASPFSRLPVYRGGRDQIVGTLRIKDLVGRYVTDGPAHVERLVRPLARIAADLPADQVVTLLRERRARQAVVEDGAGRSLGLITLRDVLAEMLGAPPAEVGRT